MLSVSVILTASMCMDESEVRSLIDRLGDDRYTVRVEAQAQLESLLLSLPGHQYRELIEAATEDPDLEIARRARSALESYYNIQPRHYPVLPWIDMLPQVHAERQAIIESCLSQVRPPGSWGYGADWPEYRQATAVLTRRLLDQGFPRHCVRQLLDDMVHQEQQYREKHGMRELASRN
ncbi:MAG TPA: hypothetical protein VKE70_04020 [Candidatus Solibacter sp.]|nr:hypothetical protein [Candidatus Solibacter sp.]